MDDYIKLIKGEVICYKCMKGHMIPFNPDFPPEENHCFVCDNPGCIGTIMFEPAVEIE